MSESPHKITGALLRVVADAGHGGPFSEYRVDSGADGYKVTLRVSAGFAGPGGRLPPSLTEVLEKDDGEVEEFLRRLSAEFDVYGLADMEPAHPFLHPTFYTFSFRDSAGGSHGFEYRIECSNHLDERYGRLVREFETFFESARVFGKFFESRRPGE